MGELPATQVAPPVEKAPACEVCQGRPFETAVAKVKAYREHFRKHHGRRVWSQAGLAKLTRELGRPELPGVAKDTIKALERGKTSPHGSTFEAIANAFREKTGLQTDGNEIQDPHRCAVCRRNHARPTGDPELRAADDLVAIGPAPPPPAGIPEPRPNRGRGAVLAVTVGFLSLVLWIVATVAADPTVHRARRYFAEKRYSFLYGEFFREPSLLVLSAPPVYRYVNTGDAVWRSDPRFAEIRAIAIPAEVARPSEERSLTHAVRTTTGYTGMGEAIAALEVQRVFMEVTGSAPRIANPDTAMRTQAHKISLGGWISNPASSIVADPRGSRARAELESALVFRTHDGMVYRAAAGRETEVARPDYEIVNGEVIPRTDYAIITKVREPVDGRVLIVVAGVNSQGTHAAGRLISSHVDQLHRWLTETFGTPLPEAFQVLVRVPVERNGRPGERVQLVEAVAIAQGGAE